MIRIIYGYARISTLKQNIERQIRNIKKYYPEALIIKEAYTGTSFNRKEWNKLFNIVKAGDVIVFDSVSRMSRDAEEGFKIYKELFYRKVELIFLKEPHINTMTYKKAFENHIRLTGTAVDHILEGVNKFLLAVAEEQIKLAFQQAEKEVTDLRQRTKEGIETARLNGKQIGLEKRKKLVTKKSVKAKQVIFKHSKDFEGSLSDSEVIKLAGIGRNTYYKYNQSKRIIPLEYLSIIVRMLKETNINTFFEVDESEVVSIMDGIEELVHVNRDYELINAPRITSVEEWVQL